MIDFTEQQIQRYSRHILLKDVGVEGQEKIMDARVLVVGAGGLGSPVSLYLAAAGIGTIGVVDADIDGKADVIICDVNNSGTLEQDEVQNVQSENIAMQPFQEAAGFQPDLAQNDLPDYDNNANVDEYMA